MIFSDTLNDISEVKIMNLLLSQQVHIWTLAGVGHACDSFIRLHSMLNNLFMSAGIGHAHQKRHL